MALGFLTAVLAFPFPTAFAPAPAPAADLGSARPHAWFQGVGFLGTGTRSFVYDLSADGRVAVGESHYGHTNTSITEAFAWTRAGGLVGLGDLDGGTVTSGAQGVSADGGVACGSSGARAFRWTSAGGMEDVGLWSPLGISADGIVLVGFRDTPQGRIGVRWSRAKGLEDLGSLPGGIVDAFLADASADGERLAGQSMSGVHDVEPVIWDRGRGLVGLGDLPGGIFYGLGFAISDAGDVVVGSAISDVGLEALRWTSTGGLESLDPVGSLVFSSEVYAISADGSLVGGFAAQVGGAALWDERHGFRSVRALLATARVEPAGWQLGAVSAVEIAPDAVVVAGYGTNPAGRPEGWVAALPRPLVLAP